MALAPFPFLLIVLASYRLAYMLANEEGPFSIFLNFRDRVGQGNWIGRGFHCTLCLSVYISAILLWLWSEQVLWLQVVIAWLALAGGVLVLHRGLLGGHD